ncbi:DUF72 domain-containing protein [Streptomyces alboflavus]|uniref:DUF72 domain-containing protein n=1 Tax=Streptomyces alboflavus TaxID=67267 RepID=UPI0036B12B67
MNDILVGTCSWTDPALVRSGWYPKGRRDAEGRLRYYAGRFPVVEVDASYYALPQEHVSRMWVERTPEDFVFDVKAFSLLTGHGARDAVLPDGLPADVRDSGVLDEVWARFSEGCGPLRRAGRLGSVLFQFPPWLRPGARAEQILAQTARRTAGWPVAVEFRHPAWWRAEQAESTVSLLAEHGMTAVAVDMAQGLPSSLPPVTPVTTSRLAVVRFHGRSTSWGRGSKEDRFRYTYSDDELAAWLPRLRDLAARVERVHVLFNNCCGDASVCAAEQLTRLVRRQADQGGTQPHGGTGERTW